MNVLVWPATSEIGREVIRSLQAQRDVHLILASNTPVSNDGRRFERIQLPDVEADPSDAWNTFQLACEHYRIDVVYPCHDVVHAFLANRYRSDEAYAWRMVGPDASTVQQLRSKSWTAQLLSKDVTVPTAGYNGHGMNSYPRFIKPDVGQGSRGVYQRIDSVEALHAFRQNVPLTAKHLTLEYLPGKEFTIDCFSSGGRLLWSMVRERVETRAGISTLTRRVGISTIQDMVLCGLMREWAERIHHRMRMRGAWFFQVKLRESGVPVLLEVAPRIGGGSGLALANNVNLPMLSVLDALDTPRLTVLDSFFCTQMVRPLGNVYQTAFWDTLVMDIDDTLVVHGHVNTQLMRLVHQALNDDKIVRFITRDGTQLLSACPDSAFMLKSRIIIVDREPLAKVEAIRQLGERPAVFVDDSFTERERVAGLIGIPVFDAAGAECLIKDEL